MKMRLILIITLIFVFSSLTGCISTTDEENNENKGYQLFFETSIKLEGIDNYLIYLPLIEGWDTLIDDITIIQGNINYSVIETEYGKSLCLNGTGNMQINAERIYINRPTINITLFDQMNLNANIFCKKIPTNGEVSLLWSFSDSALDEKAGGYGYKIDEDLENEWKEYKISTISIGG